MTDKHSPEKPEEKSVDDKVVLEALRAYKAHKLTENPQNNINHIERAIRLQLASVFGEKPDLKTKAKKKIEIGKIQDIEAVLEEAEKHAAGLQEKKERDEKMNQIETAKEHLLEKKYRILRYKEPEKTKEPEKAKEEARSKEHAHSVTWKEALVDGKGSILNPLGWPAKLGAKNNLAIGIGAASGFAFAGASVTGIPAGIALGFLGYQGYKFINGLSSSSGGGHGGGGGHDSAKHH